MQSMKHEAFIGVRSASDVKDVLDGIIDLTLGIATQGYFDPATPTQDVQAACLVNADFHDLAARHGGVAMLDESDEARLKAQGRDDGHLDHLRRLIRSTGGDLVFSDANVRARLEHLGARHLPNAVGQDRLLMHRAVSEGQRRATFFNDPRVVDSGDRLSYLMTHGGALVEHACAGESDSVGPLTRNTRPQSEQRQETSASSSPPSSPLLSGLVDGIVANIVQLGGWTPGVGDDARRVLKQFIWMVGDKPCLEYTQLNLSEYRDRLLKMPKSVRVQSVWHEPYDQASGNFPERTTANTRSNKTINKDLSYISTFAKEMVAVGHWPKDFINPLALTAVVTLTEKSEGRVPWAPEHIEEMFKAPLFHGNAGPKRRLKEGGHVFHDAGYWMPLLASYQLARRDEIAGLHVRDFVFNQGVAHMLIRRNEHRGLKTEDSERVLPIHPRLLELGLQEFVEAAAADGQATVFPELWVNAAKKGGDQYYAIGWKKLIDWLRLRPGIVIPAAPSGKEADFHSIRSTGLSQLDRADINQNIVADIAGHSRKGTTARSYQKLLQSGGLDEVLQERLKVLMRLPDYAAGITRHKLNVMHVKMRTR